MTTEHCTAPRSPWEGGRAGVEATVTVTIIIHIISLYPTILIKWIIAGKSMSMFRGRRGESALNWLVGNAPRIKTKRYDVSWNFILFWTTCDGVLWYSPSLSTEKAVHDARHTCSLILNNWMQLESFSYENCIERAGPPTPPSLARTLIVSIGFNGRNLKSCWLTISARPPAALPSAVVGLYTLHHTTYCSLFLYLNYSNGPFSESIAINKRVRISSSRPLVKKEEEERSAFSLKGGSLSFSLSRFQPDERSTHTHTRNLAIPFNPRAVCVWTVWSGTRQIGISAAPARNARLTHKKKK